MKPALETAVLDPLGVSDAEERVYRALLWNSAAAPGDLARVAGVGRTQLRGLLSSLEMKGLVSRSAGRCPGYVPVAPDVAVEGLIQRQQEELELIRAYVPQLRKEYRHPADRGDPADFVEVISDRKAVARRFIQLQQSAAETILVFDKPPYALHDKAVTSPTNLLEFERLKQGIRYRAIYSNEALASPGLPQLIQAYAEAGEEARISSELPMKLAIADRQLAIIPLVVHGSTHDAPSQVESAVVVHQSSLLDALATLFEAIWDRALPLSFSANSTEGGNPPRSAAESSDRGLLLTLLMAGLTDEAIAHQLHISIRTVRRRIRYLMDRLGAVSRFQAGFQAAKRGWR